MDITPNPKYVERAAQMLIDSKNPILHVGPEVWTSGDVDVVRLAEMLGMPVTQAWSWAADFPPIIRFTWEATSVPCASLSNRSVPEFRRADADREADPPMVSRTAKIIDARVDSRQPGADYPLIFVDSRCERDRSSID